VDNEGHLVISGQRFMVPFEGWEEGTVFIRQKVKAEA